MNLADLHFQSWQWLLLLPLLWAYLVWWFQWSNKNKLSTSSIVDIDISSSNQFFHPLTAKLAEASTAQLQAMKAFWEKAEFWWYLSILSLLLLALAQPILVGKRLPAPPPERDIIFLVDVSISMQLADYQADGKSIKRIAVLRNLLDEFTTKMNGEKISVILFAENAYVLVPLTNDQNLIHSMLARISTTLAGRYTAVGDALLMALNESFNTNIKQQTVNKKMRHQTFILFTDADSSRGKVSISAAAKLIAENGTPVFTIAVGSTNIKQDKDIKGGLYQPVDLDLLENIAKQTKGKSYPVSDSNTMHQALQDVLKQRENIAISEPQYETRQLYSYPLSVALMLLILFQILRLYEMTKKGGGVL